MSDATPSTRTIGRLTARTVQPFVDGQRGRVLGPDHEGYDLSRKLYNGMIDRRPRLIAQCADVADVMRAVDFGRENGLTTAVRSGGHNAGGLGSVDDGLVVDLSPMRGVRVDPEARTARVQGGCTWGDVDHATHAFGLATPSGIISTTGVGGLTLGGGLGHLSRKHGLTVDNLLEADVVLADGSFVTASEEEHSDLFWALRGGGGNFGVVTSFLFRLHPIDMVYAGPTLWEIDRAPEVMRWWEELLADAPDDLNGFFAFLEVPPAPPFPEPLHTRTMCGVVWYWAGDLEEAEEVFEPIRAFGPPAFEHLGPVPHPAVQSMFDALYPPGLQWYWRGDFVKELPDEAIERHVEHGRRLPTLHSSMHLYPVDGAVHDVGEDQTAFSHRDCRWAEVIVGVDPEPNNTGLIKTWCVDYWEDLHPYSAGGAYVNFLMEEGDERVRATYRDNFDRLTRVKAEYDPDNFFRVNQNIPPAT